MTGKQPSTQGAKIDQVLETVGNIANQLGDFVQQQTRMCEQIKQMTIAIDRLNKTTYGNGNEKEGLTLRVHSIEIALNKLINTLEDTVKLVGSFLLLTGLGAIVYLIVSHGTSVLP